MFSVNSVAIFDLLTPPWPLPTPTPAPAPCPIPSVGDEPSLIIAAGLFAAVAVLIAISLITAKKRDKAS